MQPELQLLSSDSKTSLFGRSDSSIITGNLLQQSIEAQNAITSTPAVHHMHPKSDQNQVDSSSELANKPISSTLTSSSTSNLSVCKTPARGAMTFGSEIFGCTRTPGSGGPRGTSSSDRLRRYRGSNRTPSGPRINPFDSHISMEMLQYPTFSPSVFSTVVSPSQDSVNGRFWSVDQQAHLFPAQISDDSPWKQETAISRLDPDQEDRTQEAIDMYFSRHSHQITSPDDILTNSRSVLMTNRSVLMTSQGGSPNLSCGVGCATPVAMESSSAESKNLAGKANSMLAQEAMEQSGSNSILVQPAKRHCSQWTQTECTFPSVLPAEVEAVLAKFFTFKEDQSSQVKCFQVQTSSVISSTQQVVSGPSEEGNNSTLRRKLFAGLDESSDNDSLAEEDRTSKSIDHDNGNNSDIDNKENEFSNIIMPGSIMFTPTSNKKEKTPNKSLSWSVSPVSRKKSIKGPLGSSTPTKT